MKQKLLCLLIISALISTEINAQLLSVKQLETILIGGAEKAKNEPPTGFAYMGGSYQKHAFGSLKGNPADFLYFLYGSSPSINYRIPSKTSYASFRSRLKNAGYTEKKSLAFEKEGVQYTTYASARFYIVMNSKDETDTPDDKYYQITIVEIPKDLDNKKRQIQPRQPNR